jgi:hypothetical protein
MPGYYRPGERKEGQLANRPLATGQIVGMRHKPLPRQLFPTSSQRPVS